MKKRNLLSLSIAGGALMFSSLVSHADNVDSTTIIDVDYRGKPPFKRVVKTVPAGDATQFARFEESGAARPGQVGKPPFDRSKKSSSGETVEFARFEEADEPVRNPSGTRPPFKR